MLAQNFSSPSSDGSSIAGSKSVASHSKVAKVNRVLLPVLEYDLVCILYVRLRPAYAGAPKSDMYVNFKTRTVGVTLGWMLEGALQVRKRLISEKC